MPTQFFFFTFSRKLTFQGQPYYGNSDLGRRDVCSHCGNINAEVNSELKKVYKTVLPICNDCIKDGKQPYVARQVKL